MLGGAWLGGQKGMMLIQSSGVGNCINMLALIQECRMPFLTIVTMRGEWGEFNPWQCPMGQSTQAALESAGVFVRSEERSVGKECVSPCRVRWSPYHEKKKTQERVQL